MRVLMAANVPPGSGGVAEHVHQVAGHLGPEGAEVRTAWRRRSAGWRMPGGLDTLGFSLAVGRLLRGGAYDVLHTHGSDGVVAQRLAGRATASVLTCHGDEREAWRLEQNLPPRSLHRPKPWSRLLVPMTRLPLFTKALHDADVVIALHEGEATRFRRERCDRPEESVVVIPNGCAPPLSQTQPHVGDLAFFGGWYWRKGPVDLVQAFSEARAIEPTLRLTLAGATDDAVASFDPADRDSVRAAGWLGRVEIESILAKTDLLVVTSVFEGMPLAVLDALACGVPVVAYDLPGIRACAAECGVLVPPGRASQLAGAIVRLVRNREERERLAAAARDRASAFSWEAVARATLDAYEFAMRLCNNSPVERPGEGTSRDM